MGRHKLVTQLSGGPGGIQLFNPFHSSVTPVNPDGSSNVIFTLQLPEGESNPAFSTEGLSDTIINVVPGIQVLEIQRFGKFTYYAHIDNPRPRRKICNRFLILIFSLVITSSLNIYF